MALTFPRWLSAAVIGCALLLVAVWRGGVSTERPPLPRRDDLARRAGSAHNQITAAVDRLRVLELRDSLAARHGGTATSNGTVYVDRHFSSELRTLFDAVVQREPQTLSPAGVPMDVAFVLDSGRAAPSAAGAAVAQAVTLSGRASPGRVARAYLLPALGSDDRCLALVRVDQRGNGGMYGGRYDLVRAPSLAGPCAYYQAFGRPGPAIDRWLRERGWMLGQRTAWRRALAARADAAYWPAYRSPFYFFDGWAARQDLTPAGIRCHAGDIAACERALFDPAKSGPATWGDGIITFDPRRTTELGMVERQLRSEMVRTLGPDRFAQFWHSTESPAAAFKTAAGVSMGEWTHDLLVRTYGEQHLGPGIETASMGMGALVLAIGLGVGLAAARRRTIG